MVIDQLQARLDSTLSHLELNAHLYGVDSPEAFRVIGNDARREILLIWATVQDLIAQLDAIRFQNQGFYDTLPADLHFGQFIDYYTAFLVQNSRALAFIRIIDRNAALHTILDEAQPHIGLLEKSFSRFKTHFLNVKQTAEYARLRRIYRNERPEVNPYYTRIAMLEGYTSKLGWDYGVKLTLDHGSDLVGDQSFSLWFPIQKDIANWAGNTRLHRKGEALLTAEDVQDIAEQLQPGDILFQRREWYLTNAGIPGYWTHTALSIGSRESREQYLDADSSVQKWVRQQGVSSGSVDDLLAQRFPAVYTQLSKQTTRVQDAMVIEAIAPGVVFQTLEESLTCDGLGVLRPKLSRLEIAQALLNAFQYHGRGYDYNFDFATDSTLVCSELVYKTYHPENLETGIAFELEVVAGRLLAPVNALVKQFDKDEDDLGLEFVLFYDGEEFKNRSVPNTEEAFRESWRRLGIYPLIPAESLLLPGK